MEIKMRRRIGQNWNIRDDSVEVVHYYNCVGSKVNNNIDSGYCKQVNPDMTQEMRNKILKEQGIPLTQLPYRVQVG